MTDPCVDHFIALFSPAHCEISLVQNCAPYKCIFKHWIYPLIRPCFVFIVHSQIVCRLKRHAQLVHCVRRQKDLCSVMYKFAPCCHDWVDGAFQQHLAWQQGQDRKKIYSGLLMMQKSCGYIINLLSPQAQFERKMIWGSFRHCLLFPSLNICHEVLTSTNPERRWIPNKFV